MLESMSQDRHTVHAIMSSNSSGGKRRLDSESYSGAGEVRLLGGFKLCKPLRHGAPKRPRLVRPHTLQTACMFRNTTSPVRYQQWLIFLFPHFTPSLITLMISPGSEVWLKVVSLTVRAVWLCFTRRNEIEIVLFTVVVIFQASDEADCKVYGLGSKSVQGVEALSLSCVSNLQCQSRCAAYSANLTRRLQ